MSPSYASDEAIELITYILPDFNAVHYFARDFENHNEFCAVQYSPVSGFDIYLVEQWVHNRNISSVISTFTGNPSSQVTAVKFTCIKKPSRCYPVRFQEYLNELIMNHAKIKQMNEANKDKKIRCFEDLNHPNFKISDYDTDEFLFVTNISSLPSNLNLIPVVSGDVRSIEADFVINSNLKKLQCSGRSISLITPNISDASEDKFRRMYKVYNVNVPIRYAIKELVNVVQTCLFYFDLLDVRYCDGLLCNKTEEAIVNWWNLIGLPHFNYKPNLKSCVLTPTTVAAIVSMLLSVKIRLQIFGGCDVPRDPLDFENFMISIGEFQKQIKFEKKRKLDLETLSKLITITNNKLKYEKSNEDDELIKVLNSDSMEGPVNSPLYKKNKSYTKEIKKLTSVVRNTVQDRISTVNRPDDDTYFDKGSTRIRERLAKLADTPNPFEVETLDLEQLVKTSLVGKRLKRLWLGRKEEEESLAPGQSPSRHMVSTAGRHPSHHDNEGHHPHLHHRHKDKIYRFISLKDAVFSQGLNLNSPNKYSRGLNLNRMRLGLQKNIMVNQKKVYHDANLLNRKPSMIHTKPNLSNGLNIVDQLLNIPDDSVTVIPNNDEASSTKSSNRPVRDNCLEWFNGRLTRRMSYPFFNKDINLNALEIYQDTEYLPPPLKRTNSDSMFQIPLNGSQVIERVASDYLTNLKNIIALDNLKKKSRQQNNEIEEDFSQLNEHIAKLRSSHRQLQQSKLKLRNEDLASNLGVALSNLSANIDRLVYESRIVVKRVNEIEQSTAMLTENLNAGNLEKMNELINNVIFANKFNKVFAKEERNDIVMKLTNDEDVIKQLDSDASRRTDHTIIRAIAIFLYEMIAISFQVFKFDTSKMNLDRIRAMWSRLDPNRQYINRAYEYIGHDTKDRRSSRGSVGSMGG